MTTRSELLGRLLSGSWRPDPPPAPLTAAELQDLAPLLHGSGAAGLGWWRVRGSALAGLSVAAGLRDAYRLQMLRNAVREGEIREIQERLRSAGVESIVIKGWAAARTYADPGLRPYGDIDLVVMPSQRSAAEALLKGRELVDFDHAEFYASSEREIATLFDRSQTAGGIRFPGPEDHLRLLCLHFLRHGGWRPLWLCDISAALDSLPATFDWDLCCGSRRNEAGGIECCVTLAHRLLDAPVEPRTRLPHWFLPAVHKQWDKALYVKHEIPPAIADSPWKLAQSLRRRWPDPITATMLTGAPFNAVPRLIFQIAYYGFLARRYWRRTTGRGQVES